MMLEVKTEQKSMQLEFLEIYQLAVVANRSSQSVASLFEADFDLQVTDWRVIALLDGMDYLTFKEVVERTGMDKSRVSRAHMRMQKAGLIQVAEGPFDKRTLVLKLTPKGSEMLKKVMPKARQLNDWLLEALTETEQTHFKVMLEKLRKRVKNMDLNVVFTEITEGVKRSFI